MPLQGIYSRGAALSALAYVMLKIKMVTIPLSVITIKSYHLRLSMISISLQVLAEYNRSVICFENTLKIQPDFEAAAKRRHAVLCHSKLETMLESKHR